MTEALEANAPAPGWRLTIGVALFALSIVLPLLGVPLVAAMGLSTSIIATASGVMLGSAEVLGIIAIAVMGKSGFAYIKNRVLGFFKKIGPPAEVGRTRYTIGLILFTVPLVFGWLAPYLSDLIPGYHGNEFAIAISGDLIWLVSLFVLGGDFWEKLRALFVHDAKAMLPEKTG